MTGHRKDDQRRKVPKGFCTWCGDELLVTEAGLQWAKQHLKPKDEVFGRKIGDKWPRVRSWHPWCVEAFFLRNNPGQVRVLIDRRDHGRCAYPGCGRWDGWDADHIVPLVDGGSFELANLQTLCHRHHKEKTSREARERAKRRKSAKATPPGDR